VISIGMLEQVGKKEYKLINEPTLAVPVRP
jgi:hypothetical protein